jgi:hypothetical protein
MVLILQLKDADWLNGFKNKICFLSMRTLPYWEKHTQTERGKMGNNILSNQNLKARVSRYLILITTY